MYQDTKLCKTRLHNGACAWAMSPTKYVCEAVRNCEVHFLTKYGDKYNMHKKTENPFKMGCDTELDTSPELDLHAASYYLTIIGILSLIFELGRIDMITKLLLLTSHVSLPKERAWKQQCMSFPMLVREKIPIGVWLFVLGNRSQCLQGMWFVSIL